MSPGNTEQVFCMLERNEGAQGGTGVAKTLARSITIRFKEPLPTVVTALKMT